MNRREFLKGLLASTALVALPTGKLGYTYFQTYAVCFTDVPLRDFTKIPNIAFTVGEFLGDQLFPETLSDQTGPRLKRLKDGTLWTREEERPEEGLHP